MQTGAKLPFGLALLAVLVWPLPWICAQDNASALPEVTEHGPVGYPPLARMAHIQGQVHLKVRTDGHAVTEVGIVDGHPLLAAMAVQNVRTWKFVEHVPATFDVTFIFRMVDDGSTFLQQPGLVQVVSSRECCIDNYTFPEKWGVQVRNAEGTIDAPLTLWTYHSFETQLDGFTTGPQGQERAIRNPHIDGDMLGFDATLDDKYGQRLKFSMIGKITGNEIRGVLLNYWGSKGTWNAKRVANSISEPGSTSPTSTEETKITGSDVAYHAVPLYSVFSNEAGIQGTVRLRVTTDGLFVTKFEVQSGNPFLVRNAIENLRSWRFARNAPQTFEVTYTYELKIERVEFLEQSGVVTVDGTTPLPEGSFATLAAAPEIWQMELASPRGNLHTKFSLLDTGDLPDGYVVNELPGSTGKKREPIREPHQDGDMLGFDATINGADGKPLKVSVVGKETGGRIAGVFLDYDGTPGTWTAVREPAHAKSPR